MKIKLIPIYIVLFLLACSGSTEIITDEENTNLSISKNDSNSNSEKKQAQDVKGADSHNSLKAS